jgi:hypothetical protein
MPPQTSESPAVALPQFLYAAEVNRNGLVSKDIIRCTLTENDEDPAYWHGEDEGGEILVETPGLEVLDDGKTVRYSSESIGDVNMFIMGARAVYTAQAANNSDAVLEDSNG